MRIKDFSGPVHLPGEAGYDAQRLAWNSGVDPRPAIVAEAVGPADVRAAVLTAREHGLPLSVQATGHGTLVPGDGGLLLRTGRMAGVEVDPARRTAVVEPGALWSDVIAAAAPYGLAPLSGTPSIGVTGYTLGGGTGWLSRRYGFAADSLICAELVTADGELLEVADDSHPDLFWALRGGSGNFGLVTRMEFRLYPVGRVFAGLTMHAFERAADTLACYRDWALTEPDTLNTAIFLVRRPDGGRMLGLRVFSMEENSRALAPLLEAAGEPLSGNLAEMSFELAGAMLAPEHPRMPLRNQFELFHELPDDLIGRLLDSPADGIEVRHWGGAMAGPGGPAGHRDVPFSVNASEPVDLPHATGGTFLNFLSDPSRTASAFTEENHARLVELKKAWDPDVVLRPSHVIEG